MIGAIILQVILIALNAVFTCAETAIVSLNDNQLEEMAKKDEAKAALLSGFKAKQERFLTAMQLVSMASVCLGSAYAALVFRKPLEDFIGKSGQAINPNVLDGLCVTAISLVLCIVTMIFGRMVPKRLAAEKEEEMAVRFSSIVYVVQIVFFPLIWLLIAASHTLLRLCGVDPHRQTQITEEEIRLMAESGSQKGTIDTQENEFIQNVFEFNDVSVDEICTHRKDVVCVYADESREEWEKVIYENRHSFYVVCGEDTDDIVGVLDAREYLRSRDHSREAVMKNCVRKPYFIPENMKAASLFSNMKKTGNYFAVAIDDIEKIGDSLWRIQGAASLDEVAEELDVELPLDEYDTFGGYVLGELCYVPDDGTQVSVLTPDLEIMVTSIKDHRVEETTVRKRIVQEEQT